MNAFQSTGIFPLDKEKVKPTTFDDDSSDDEKESESNKNLNVIIDKNLSTANTPVEDSTDFIQNCSIIQPEANNPRSTTRSNHTTRSTNTFSSKSVSIVLDSTKTSSSSFSEKSNETENQELFQKALLKTYENAVKSKSKNNVSQVIKKKFCIKTHG